jgi:site-specific DNA recombinase
MWMGGFVPMGYDVLNRKLLVNDAEAATVRMIFERFAQIGSATTLVKALVAEGVRNKRGKPIDKGFLYKLLNNRIYVGDAVHKGTSYPGEHAAIIDQALWDKVHTVMQVSPRTRAAGTRNQTPALLKGLIFGPTGTAMTPTATKKGSRLYRYYASMDVIRGRATGGSTAPLRLTAEMVENAVIHEIRRLVRAPEIVAQTIASVRQDQPDMDDREVVEALRDFDAVWSSLFPAEQARIVRLLVERVTITGEGIAVDLCTGGLGSIVRDMLAPRATAAVA